MSDACTYTWDTGSGTHRCAFPDHEVMTSDAMAVTIHGCPCGARREEVVSLQDALAKQRQWHAEHD
jgi:hypothetical protein